MNTRSSKYVTYGQWNLIVFVLLCLSIHPGFVLKRDEGGFSNYGVHIRTVVPYTLTYLGCVIFTLLAAKYLPASGTLRGFWQSCSARTRCSASFCW